MTMRLKNQDGADRRMHFSRGNSRASTVDYSDISKKSVSSLWNRSISKANENRGAIRYRHKLNRRFDHNNTKAAGAEPMSHNWEMVNRLVNQTAGGDDEALPYLKTLLASEYADEALHQQDNASPYWTLLHKFAFYGCPKCADIVIKAGADLYVVDASRNRPLDLARFGQSPQHRDITKSLSEAMRKSRAKALIKKAKEEKAGLHEGMLAEELGYREEEQDLSSHASEAPSSLGSVSKWTKRTQDDNTPTLAMTIPAAPTPTSPPQDGTRSRQASTPAFPPLSPSNPMPSTNEANSNQQPAPKELENGDTSNRGSASLRKAGAFSLLRLLGLRKKEPTVLAQTTGDNGSGNGSDVVPLPSIAQQRSNDSSVGFTQSLGTNSWTLGGPQTTLSPDNIDYEDHDYGDDDVDVDNHPEPMLGTQRGKHHRQQLQHPSITSTVIAGKRPKGARTGANSRFIDPKEKQANMERYEDSIKVIREIYRTDFRQGTFNRDLLPHVAAHVDALMSTIPALDPALEKHIAVDDVDEVGEYSVEASVVTGGLGLKEFLEASDEIASSHVDHHAHGAERYAEKTPGHGPPTIRVPTKDRHLSLSTLRRTGAAVRASRDEAAELRMRDGLAVLGDPGWTSGSRTAHGSHLYRSARQHADDAQQAMADVPRLGAQAPLGGGSHAYRIGGTNHHAEDKRLAALHALAEQRRKHWFNQSPVKRT